MANWSCPKCETLNNGDTCIVCGLAKPPATSFEQDINVRWHDDDILSNVEKVGIPSQRGFGKIKASDHLSRDTDPRVFRDDHFAYTSGGVARDGDLLRSAKAEKNYGKIAFVIIVICVLAWGVYESPWYIWQNDADVQLVTEVTHVNDMNSIRVESIGEWQGGEASDNDIEETVTAVDAPTILKPMRTNAPLFSQTDIPTPKPTSTPTPKPKATAKPTVASSNSVNLPKVPTGRVSGAHLQEAKAFLRSGPGTNYTELTAIAQSTNIKLLFKEYSHRDEIWWVCIEYKAKNGKMQQAYTGEWRFNVGEFNAPSFAGESITGEITQSCYATYGPGSEYTATDTQLKKGSSVYVIGAVEQYAMIEFSKNSGKLVRGFVPRACVSF